MCPGRLESQVARSSSTLMVHDLTANIVRSLGYVSELSEHAATACLSGYYMTSNMTPQEIRFIDLAIAFQSFGISKIRFRSSSRSQTKSSAIHRIRSANINHHNRGIRRRAPHHRLPTRRGETHRASKQQRRNTHNDQPRRASRQERHQNHRN